MSLPELSNYSTSLENAAEKYAKNLEPLTLDEVTELAAIYGPNTIVTKKQHSCHMVFLQALLHPFNILLTVIAILSAIASLSHPSVDYSTTIIICVMILISTSLRFYQEWKSEGSLGGLLKLITKSTFVIRIDPVEGVPREMSISSEQLVPGDWVVLRPGEVVPADGVVLASKVFFVSQAPLTGEALPVEKHHSNKFESVEEYNLRGHDYNSNSENSSIPGESKKPRHKPVSKVWKFLKEIFGVHVSAESQLDSQGYMMTEDLSSPENVFMGSQVITGMATVLITRTGHNALFGKLAKVLLKAPSFNAFQRGVRRISWMFFIAMILMVPPIFLIFGLNNKEKDKWTTAFVFSMSVAVGLTPGMLPMIVNANLAKGSVALSKKYAIVKNLDAIINLGTIDVLCTDKTGTLTKSVIRLSSHIDPAGAVSSIPLQIGFLNSYFQSVLQNPLDSAIVSFYDKVISPAAGVPMTKSDDHVRRKTYLVSDATIFAARFSRVDELPFDFVRRRISVILKESIKDQEKVYLACKGAVEEVLSVCVKTLIESTKVNMDEDQVFPADTCTIHLNQEIRENLTDLYSQHAHRGERVLAVAYKTMPKNTTSAKAEDEKDLIFAGFITFLDPPKSTTKDAVQDLLKHNIEIKVLTGDSPNISMSVCNSINLPIKATLTGQDVQQGVENGNLATIVEQGTIFAKLTPLQKALVVQTLSSQNHVVGFVGDGINDAPALKEADVGISVDNGVDICREASDVILLDKDLNVIVDGIIIGRKTYGNTIKYIAMVVSSNFGNVFSVLVAACMLPYAPMTSLQILIQNLLYDISQIAIPWDSVDKEFLLVPHKWRMKRIVRFMVWMGPWSSVFDIITFVYLYYGHDIKSSEDKEKVRVFQTTWFTLGLLTQTLIVHVIRTPKIPIFQSRASTQLTLMTVLTVTAGLLLPFIPDIHNKLEFSTNPLPAEIYGFIALMIISYCIAATIAKSIYVKIFKEWF